MLTFVRDWFLGQGLDADLATWAAKSADVVLVIGLALLADLITKRVVVGGLSRLATRTPTRVDDLVVERRVFHRLSHLAPALVVYLFAPQVFEGQAAWVTGVRQVCLIHMVLVGISVLDSLLNMVVDIVHAVSVARELPLRSVVQILKLVLYCVGFIVLFSLVLNRSPFLIFSGLGALTAILMLVFKDPILGFVAGIQLAANRMVAPGDWIEMPNYGANGDVMEVGLTTVKIQNFDKTITTIPTYALISESFKNWRGMSESGGRRIKRAINIDLGSIRFCDADLLERLARIPHVADHLPDPQAPTTNVGMFRAYLHAYLRHHPKIHQGMTLLVRELAPTAHGLPIEIYAFSNDPDWGNYESIQADILDHILAMVPEFDLRVFQDLSGADVQGALSARS